MRTLVDQGTVPNFPGATNPGSTFAMLIGQDASNIVITEIEADPEGSSGYSVGFHFGLIQDTTDEVPAKHAELTEAGLNPEPVGPRFDVLGATWTAFYCHLGDGPEIVVNHRIHSDRRRGHPAEAGRRTSTRPGGPFLSSMERMIIGSAGS